MSRKKTPICPFCKSEMKREPGATYYGAVMNPTKLSESDAQAYQQMINLSQDEWMFQVYICSGCGFVALWRGEF